MSRTDPATTPQWPIIRTVGLSGLLVTFSDRLTEPANRAALAFGAAVERAGWPELQEVSTTLASTFLRIDTLALPHAAATARLTALLSERAWYDAPLPEGRRHWRIPTVYDSALAPQFSDAAAAAGQSEADARRSLSEARIRVLTIGFAPGQPYLGTLPAEWDIPRQSELTPKVPEGALVVAIRQFVLFAISAPTGWRHVGQTAFRSFRPETDSPFVLRPGDEVTFAAVDREKLQNIRDNDASGNGGAVSRPIR